MPYLIIEARVTYHHSVSEEEAARIEALIEAGESLNDVADTIRGSWWASAVDSEVMDIEPQDDTEESDGPVAADG